MPDILRPAPPEVDDYLDRFSVNYSADNGRCERAPAEYFRTQTCCVVDETEQVLLWTRYIVRLSLPMLRHVLLYEDVPAQYQTSMQLQEPSL